MTAPAKPQKNWGVVETTTSGLPARKDARMAAAAKRTKLAVRFTKPALGVRSIQVRSTRMPSTCSSWMSLFR
jgi:hypothetical protein